jgi:SAM-dependent methyltransferase
MQGLHIDPLDPSVPKPSPADWTSRQRRAFRGAGMNAFRAGLLAPGITDVRTSVIDDLSSCYALSPEECVERCIHWERWSVEEWKAAPRDTPDSLRDFYHTTQSWSFDLLWYAYLQAEGYMYPVSAAIAETVMDLRPGEKLEHLDFGSGVGATSQMFSNLGHSTTLADVSTTLREFAEFRLRRRSQRATFVDLDTQSLEPGRYDVITAIDTLVHIPNLRDVVSMLHRALKPGGLLFANFDVRPPSDENAWHLYSDDLPLRWTLHRAGFEPRESLDNMSIRYERVEPAGLRHHLRGGRDLFLLRSPIRPLYRFVKPKLKLVTSLRHRGRGLESAAVRA